jgi:hypothetical protein
MKKVILQLTLVFTMAGLVLARPNNDKELIVKLGFQPQSEITVNDKNENMNAGLSAGLEFFKYFGNLFAFGFGSTMDFARNIKTKDLKGSMACLPVYECVKLVLTKTPHFWRIFPKCTNFSPIPFPTLSPFLSSFWIHYI